MISNTPEQRQYFQHNSLWCLTSCYCSLPLSSVSFFFHCSSESPWYLSVEAAQPLRLTQQWWNLVSYPSTVPSPFITSASLQAPPLYQLHLSYQLLSHNPPFFILLFNICNEIVFCRFQNDFSLSYIHHKVIRSDIWASVHPVKSLDFSFFFIYGTTTAGVSDK